MNMVAKIVQFRFTIVICSFLALAFVNFETVFGFFILTSLYLA